MSRSQAVAFSPCHITGFFRVHASQRTTERFGSTGAGVALEHGVLTKVTVAGAPRPKILVSFNGRPLTNPVVSKMVVREYLRDGGGSFEVRVLHQGSVPIGSGYGTSGAGALGLSMALNETLGKPLTKLDAASVAHGAEVKCKTGLGTVTAVFYGGFLARLKPGAPRVSEVRKFPVSKSDRIVSAAFGPVSTARVLSRSDLVARVNSCGRNLVARLLRRPSLGLFVEISRSFSNCLGLMTPRLANLMKLMDQSGVRTSMMMLGDSAFTVVHKDTVREVSGMLRNFGLVPLVSRISSQGARLV